MIVEIVNIPWKSYFNRFCDSFRIASTKKKNKINFRHGDTVPVLLKKLSKS